MDLPPQILKSPMQDQYGLSLDRECWITPPLKERLSSIHHTAQDQNANWAYSFLLLVLDWSHDIGSDGRNNKPGGGLIQDGATCRFLKP